MWDALWINARLVTCEQDTSLLYPAAIAVMAGKICWIGEMKDLNAAPQALASNVYDVGGYLLTPGLIDCHTHVIFGGNRAKEFDARLQGTTYQTIIQQGGGIHSTVTATRALSTDALLAATLPRVHTMARAGVTTLEIKSGYGLDLASEIKILKVAQSISTHLPISIFTTFLGAHCIPHPYQDNANAYVDYVCEEMLPAIAEQKLAQAVDVFSEHIAFNLPQTERIFAASKRYQLPIKCHAEQLSAFGAAQLAAKYQALSADHLEYATKQDIEALSHAQTVAVLLPGAYYYLREKQKPPLSYLRHYQTPLAIASDCNPGTSPIYSLLIIMNMACILFGLTPAEALLGVTKYAAHALGWQQECGGLSIGKKADFVIWEAQEIAELCYSLGLPLVRERIKNGKITSLN